MTLEDDFISAQLREAEQRLRQAAAEGEDFNALICEEVERQYRLTETPPFLWAVVAVVVVSVLAASSLVPGPWW